ncbi:MAG: hypothetical protein IPL10_07270 [Bacteroidetes bacterium]|nr:hypothetical protein [Bacteroidota bacterium]
MIVVEPILLELPQIGINLNASLRNIEKSEPYMHDGRFTSLNQCLEHYNSGIVASPTLETQLVGGIPLTPQNKADLIAFLKTLTDTKYLTDTRFSDNNF